MSAIKSRLRRIMWAAAIPVAILFAVAFVYAPSIDFGFLYDDHVQLEGNPWLRSGPSVSSLFTQPLWGFLPNRGAGSDY